MELVITIHQTLIHISSFYFFNFQILLYKRMVLWIYDSELTPILKRIYLSWSHVPQAICLAFFRGRSSLSSILKENKYPNKSFVLKLFFKNQSWLLPMMLMHAGSLPCTVQLHHATIITRFFFLSFLLITSAAIYQKQIGICVDFISSTTTDTVDDSWGYT